MSLEQKRDFENTIIEHAWKDEDFREALKSGNAASVIEETFGRDIPFNVNVYQDTADTVNVVLPIFDTPTSVELTDEQLEAVAGGAEAMDICWTTCNGVSSCGCTGVSSVETR